MPPFIGVFLFLHCAMINTACWVPPVYIEYPLLQQRVFSDDACVGYIVILTERPNCVSAFGPFQCFCLVHSDTLEQGSYRSWKVLEFKSHIFQAWKVLESGLQVVESRGNAISCCGRFFDDLCDWLLDSEECRSHPIFSCTFVTSTVADGRHYNRYFRCKIA